MIVALVCLTIVAITSIVSVPFVLRHISDTTVSSIEKAYDKNRDQIQSLIDANASMVGIYQMHQYNIEEMEEKQQEALGNKEVHLQYLDPEDESYQEDIDNYIDFDQESVADIYRVIG